MHSEILQRNFEKLISEFEEIKSDHLLFVIDSEIHKIYGDWTKLLQKIDSKNISYYVTNSGESAKTMVEYEKMTEFFIQKEFNDWDLESIDQNSFWGIWWFIDQKNSESEMSIAELKRNKTGDLSGPIMAEMNDGVFTINKRQSIKPIF